MLSLQELDVDSFHFNRYLNDASAPVNHGRMGEVAGKAKGHVWHKQSLAAQVAQSVRAFTPQNWSLVFESQPRQTLIVKTDSDSSTARRSAYVWVSWFFGDDHYNEYPVSQ